MNPMTPSEAAAWRRAVEHDQLPPVTGTAPVPGMPDEAFERLVTQAERSLLHNARAIASVRAAQAAHIAPFWQGGTR